MTSHQTIMRRYYIGTALIVLALAAGASTFFIRNAPSRADRISSDQLQSTSRAVQSYYRSNNKNLPASLNEVYKKSPPQTISYKKLDHTAYMLCADFNIEHKGYSYYNDYSYAPARTDYLESLLRAEKLKDPDTNFVLAKNGYYSSYDRQIKVGKNCYIVPIDNYY